MLIRGGDVEGRRVDVRIAGTSVAEVADHLDQLPNEPTIEAAGGALLPGLHDHHLHLDSLAAAMNSVRCGPPEVTNRDQLAAVLAKAGGGGWLRGVGYHSSIGAIDRAWLDTHGPARPIRIQHRGGRMWVLNSAALDLIGGGLPPDGRLIDGDSLLADRLGRIPPDLTVVGKALSRHGITGITETTPRNNARDLLRYQSAGLPQHLLVMGGHSLSGLSGAGAVKLHYHEHDLPSLDVLTSKIARAHDAGRPVAAHCVTVAELLLTLAAIEEAGSDAGDRIEHAGLAPPEAVEWIARLGCTVVSQPHFITERADAYLREVPVCDRPWLYRLRAFLDAGVPLAAGSDAPFGGLNPWASMAAAVARPSDLTQGEQISPEEALALFLGPLDRPGGQPRLVAAGTPADLCLLGAPWAVARQNLGAVAPVLTLVAGEIVHRAADQSQLGYLGDAAAL